MPELRHPVNPAVTINVNEKRADVLRKRGYTDVAEVPATERRADAEVSEPEAEVEQAEEQAEVEANADESNDA